MFYKPSKQSLCQVSAVGYIAFKILVGLRMLKAVDFKGVPLEQNLNNTYQNKVIYGSKTRLLLWETCLSMYVIRMPTKYHTHL